MEMLGIVSLCLWQLLGSRLQDVLFTENSLPLATIVAKLVKCRAS